MAITTKLQPETHNLRRIKGITIIEILVIVAILTIALVSFLGVAAFSLKISSLIKEETKANTLAQEAIEVVRNFRDGTDWGTDGLGSLTTGISYCFQKTADTPPKWTLTPGTETIDGFLREIILEKVSRDPATDDIQETYDSLYDDPNTRKIEVTVEGEDRTIEIITYLTNWRQ